MGRVTTFGYDTAGRVTSIQQLETATGGPGTSVTRLAYISGTETQLADPSTDQSLTVTAAPHTTYTLNSSKRVEDVKDAQGRPRGNTYTANFDVASTSQGLAGTESTVTNTYGANSGESLTKSATNLGLEATASYANGAGPAQYQPSGGKDAGGTSGTYAYNGTGNQLSCDPAASKTAPPTGSTTATATVTPPLAPKSKWTPSPHPRTNANRYAYAGGDPINNIDPTGKQCDVSTLASFGGVGVLLGGVGLGALYGAAAAYLQVALDLLLELEWGQDGLILGGAAGVGIGIVREC